MNWEDNLHFDYGINSVDHFSSTLMPAAPVVTSHIVEWKTPVEAVGDGFVCILYVSEGNGTILLNSQPHALQPGTILMLHSYHFFQILPDSSTALRYVKCSFTTNTLLFSTCVLMLVGKI